jgi:hypothetical protein
MILPADNTGLSTHQLRRGMAGAIGDIVYIVLVIVETYTYSVNPGVQHCSSECA